MTVRIESIRTGWVSRYYKIPDHILELATTDAAAANKQLDEYILSRSSYEPVANDFFLIWPK